MDKHETKGKLNRLTASIKQEWGKLTDDEVKQAEGNYDELVARIQEKYGESREAIAKKLNEMKERVNS
ncbi:MAG: CsbD family protein [Gammaproteobacteria bacterium]|jgi:uncharacterized protein YjbJ (UPF0337 family)|nr:CsbD family protein [Gammaproteobacteria bacterium]